MRVSKNDSRRSIRGVWFSPYLLAVVLVPAFVQIDYSGCAYYGDSRLTELELIVDGENRVVGFDPDERSYEVSFPAGTSEVQVVTVTRNSSARVSIFVLPKGESLTVYGERETYLDVGVGGSDFPVPLPLGSAVLQIWVVPYGGASDYYEVNLEIPPLIPYDPADIEYVSQLYEVPLAPETIADIFGVEVDGRIGRNEMQAFLTDKVGLIPMDAAIAARSFLAFTSPSFIPCPALGAQLILEGLTPASCSEGMTPAQFLTYLRVAHGEGRCENAAAGSPQCPAKVRDFQLHLIVLQNPIFNIRSAAPQDSQYQNKFSIHRESYANRLTLEFIGRALGLPGNPLAEVVLDDQCELLTSFLKDGESCDAFMKNEIGVIPEIATVIVHQYEGIEESYEGQLYKYGLEAFFRGEVCSRYNLGACYEDDMALYNRILELHPGFVPADDLSCAEIKDMVNVLMSYPPSISDPMELFSPPFDQESPQLTGDDEVDQLIAVGNALTNRPDAPFADIIPESDLALLNESGVYNCENELTRRSITYFYDQLLGDVSFME